MKIQLAGKTYDIALPENTDEEHEFSTYLHYVESIAGLIREHHATPASALRDPGVVTSLSRISSNSDADRKATRNFLFNAWSTELSLRVARLLGDEAIRYANHWAPVQAYYAVYLSAQALYASSGTKPSKHASALRVLSNDIKQGRLGAPAPWCVTCICETDAGAGGFDALPAGASLSKVSTLATPTRDRWWSLYALALRTTRVRLLDERCQDWKKSQKRKRTPKAERERLDKSLWRTTLFDFLYRMRLRSNYRDADAMISGQLEDHQAKAFHDGIVELVDRSLLLLEAHTRLHLGGAEFDAFAEEFIKRVGDRIPELPIRDRAKLYVNAVTLDSP
jgi:hypothetical protein